MIRFICFTAALATLGASARADEYWIAYEGDDFPENVGWERLFGNGGADRWIEDGALVIDSTRSTDIFDAYRISDISDPEPGELFVAEWRLRLDEFINHYDAKFGVARDSVAGHIEIDFGLDHIWIQTDRTRIAIAAGEWHEYRIQSADMRAFDLYIDGELLHTGTFESQSFLQSFVVFGDTVIGAASLSRWDYVRFGVVPEPTSGSLLAIGSILIVIARSGRRFRQLS